ncbi:metal ion-binding protein, putative [Medicago truncatula]|nr:metal ion-binding protein, putative [Medicago truncatula]
MNSHKSRSKAMKIAVGVSGVESAAVKGDSKDQIEVTGEQIDAAKLTCLLRKKFCHADLVSVGEVEKKEEKKEEAIVAWPCVAGYPHYPVPVCEIRDDPSCSIM